jgi:ABC-type lipoprotein release transport system permease subunit
MLAALIWTVLQVPSPSPPSLPTVAIERRLAEHLHLQVGDTVTAAPAPDSLPVQFVVGAIYEPRPDPATLMRGDYHVRFHLPDLAVLLGVPDRVDRFGIRLTAGHDPAQAAELLNRTAYGFRATPSRVVASESSRTFRVVSRFHRAIGVISILASAIFLLCIMLLKVEERRLDTAVLRLIGISRRTIFAALLLEAALVALVGSVLGTALAYLASWATNLYYQRLFATTLVFSYLDSSIVVTAAGLALGLGIAAGAAAAWRLIRTEPLALWRRAE